MKLSLNQVMLLRNSMNQEMQLQMPTWQLLAEFISPNRIKNSLFEKSGRRKDWRILQNQAGLSLRNFVSGVNNGATPKSRAWFQLTVNDMKKATLNTSKRFFHDRQNSLNSYFQISNLYNILPKAYKDVGIFSNAAFAMLPNPRFGFWFYPFAIGTYGFACDAEGNTNMFYRDFSMSVKQVVDTYGKLLPTGHVDWSNMPSYVEECYKAARYNEQIILTTVIVPNVKYDPKKLSLDPVDKKYQSYTYVFSMGNGIPPQTSMGFRNEVMSGKNLGEHEFVKISGFDYFPVITPRWDVNPEENYGIDGPGHMALSDVMTLQELQRWKLEAVSKLVKPPMVGPASLRRHQASILAGGITYVDDMGAAATFKPAFEMDPKISELVGEVEQHKQIIREAFYENLFNLFSGQESKTHVTKTEIEEKAAEKLATLAPVMGQWDLDLNSKIIYNAQIILEDQGKLAPRPRELEGEYLRPEYTSTLHLAVKAASMGGVERGANFIKSLSDASQDPALLKIMDTEKMAREYWDFAGNAPHFLRDPDELAEIKKQVAASQQQQLAAVQQQQQAATFKDLSQAELQKGSMLDNMLNASSY